MSKAIALMVGLILLGHGLVGLPIEGRPFLLFNVDLALDLLHLLCAGALLLAGREHAGELLVRGALLFTAVVEGGIGLWGLADRHLGGVAPTGLFDLDYLLTFGLAGATLIGALLPRAASNLWDLQPSPPMQS